MWSYVVLFHVLCLSLKVYCSQNVNVLFINDKDNDVADSTMEVVLNYIRRTPTVGVQVEGYSKAVVSGTEPQAVIESVCKGYSEMIASGKPPHIVIDTTLSGVTSESVKSLVDVLGLPTVSASLGQEYDLRAWRTLSAEQKKYLIQIMPPMDTVPEIVRAIVLYQKMNNAAILFDDSFIMDHKYKSLLQNVPCRHIIAAIETSSQDLRAQLKRMHDLDVVNFFVLGRLSTIRNVLRAAEDNNYFGRKYAWAAITMEDGQLQAQLSNATLLFARPEPDQDSRDRLGKLKSAFSLTASPEVSAAFYFEFILKSLFAIRNMLDKQEYPKELEYKDCESAKTATVRDNIDLEAALKTASAEDNFYGPLLMKSNGYSVMKFNMKLERASVIKQATVSSEHVGNWQAILDSTLTVKDEAAMKNLTATTIYKVVTVVQEPFVFLNDDPKKPGAKYQGYCIDLIDEIKDLVGFEYEIEEAPDKKFGTMDEKGRWNGMVKELVDKKADIALGSMSVMAERENVIDFTVPYYDLVGITILMKKSKTPTSLFKFLTVLETDVWLCILAAYFFTSFLMWVFDRWSPYSYQNNREKYKDDEEKREFNLKECLWFCMTSLTPQGGGEAPKNLSGRLVAATWWLFGFIIIASYTANLAAFLTVSRLDSPVESLEDLSKQYKIQYAPINGSSAMTYFQRMADIEQRFYEIWKDMSLNDSLSDVERAKLAVWDYPVSDKYTKMWQAMKEAKLPSSLDEAVSRVLASKSSSEGFAFLGDATDIRFLALTNCELQMVGEEFSRKPYAIAVQQGSPLKDQFNNAILQLLNKRKLEKFKERWWTDNQKKVECDKQDEQSDGISIQNIGGVFIVIFVGIGMACITLAFEYWYYKYKKNPNVGDSKGGGPSKDMKTAFNSNGGLSEGFRNTQNYPDINFRRHDTVPTVNNPW